MRFCSLALAMMVCFMFNPFAIASSPDFTVTVLNGSIPRAPHETGDARKSALCQDEVLMAYQSREERGMAKAGWLPLNTQQAADGILLVTATNALDAQCRPRTQTLFVFHTGKTVGSVTVLHTGIPESALKSGGLLNVSSTFVRKGDPHCCPTGHATRFFDITHSGIREH